MGNLEHMEPKSQAQANPQPTPKANPEPMPEAAKQPTPREEFFALLNEHHRNLNINFIQACEKLIDKHFPGE